MLATHPLTDKGTKDASGNELYADNPPATGSYAGLYNPTAITAPMDWKRWANAVGVPAVGFVVAHFIEAPTFRSALQFFSFGYGVRGFGKGIIDLAAKIATNYGFGQRLYDGEMRASVLAANQGNPNAAALSSLPAASSQAQAGAAGVPRVGAGWPSMPREPGAVSTATGTPTPPAAPAPPLPPAVATQTPILTPPVSSMVPASQQQSALRGVPRDRRGIFTPWGDAAG